MLSLFLWPSWMVRTVWEVAWELLPAAPAVDAPHEFQCPYLGKCPAPAPHQLLSLRDKGGPILPGVIGGPSFQEEMNLYNFLLAHSASTTSASLLVFEPSGHPPACSLSPDYSFSRYQHEPFPHLSGFTQMSPSYWRLPWPFFLKLQALSHPDTYYHSALPICLFSYQLSQSNIVHTFTYLISCLMKGSRIYHPRICILGIRVILSRLFLRNSRHRRISENSL